MPAADVAERERLGRCDAATLWPVVHLRRLLSEEAARLYGADPSPEGRARLDRTARELAVAETALAATRRHGSGRAVTSRL